MNEPVVRFQPPIIRQRSYAVLTSYVINGQGFCYKPTIQLPFQYPVTYHNHISRDDMDCQDAKEPW